MGTREKPNRKPSIKQQRAIDNVVVNGGNLYKAMIDAGYSPATAHTPQKLTESRAWKQIVDEFLPDESLGQAHRQLLGATTLDHMVFPLGPKGEDDDNFSGSTPDKDTTPDQIKKDRTKLTDGEIIDLLADTGCTVRKIVHGETARHVYFWSIDNNARKNALDMAYKLKGSYAPEKSVSIVRHISHEKQERSNSLIERILGNQKNS